MAAAIAIAAATTCSDSVPIVGFICSVAASSPAADLVVATALVAPSARPRVHTPAGWNYSAIVVR